MPNETGWGIFVFHSTGLEIKKKFQVAFLQLSKKKKSPNAKMQYINSNKSP